MDNLLSSVQSHIDPDSKHSKPVRIALLDSGLGDNNPFVDEAMRSKNGPIKACRSFVHGTNPQDCRDEFGHGTHALGLLHQVAPCAEIYVARIGRHATLDRSSYDDIAKVRLSLYPTRLLDRPNYLHRPSLTPWRFGAWTLYQCHSGFVKITNPFIRNFGTR